MTIHELFVSTARMTMNRIHYEQTGYIHLYKDTAVKFIDAINNTAGHVGVEYFDIDPDDILTMSHGVEIGLEEYGYGRVVVSVHPAEPLPLYMR